MELQTMHIGLIPATVALELLCSFALCPESEYSVLGIGRARRLAAI